MKRAYSCNGKTPVETLSYWVSQVQTKVPINSLLYWRIVVILPLLKRFLGESGRLHTLKKVESVDSVTINNLNVILTFETVRTLSKTE